MRNIPDDLSRLESDLCKLLAGFGIGITSIDVFHSRSGDDLTRDTNITISAKTDVHPMKPKESK